MRLIATGKDCGAVAWSALPFFCPLNSRKFGWAVLTPQSSVAVPSCVNEALKTLDLSSFLGYIINSLNLFYMINYLAQHWDLINSIHQQVKGLIIYNQTLAKSDFYVGRCLKGLQRISQKLSLWIRYSVADEKSFVIVTDILKTVNVLRNQLEVNVLNHFKPNRLKNALTDIYQQLVSILPCDVQLSLFGYGDEVGWCAEVPANTSSYLFNITEWLKARLRNGQRATGFVACFNYMCGIQLAMPWGVEAMIDLG